MAGGLKPGTDDRLLRVAPFANPAENAAFDAAATAPALPGTLGISGYPAAGAFGLPKFWLRIVNGTLVGALFKNESAICPGKESANIPKPARIVVLPLSPGV